MIVCRWVLDTHVACHKELPVLKDARQITEDEWMAMKCEKHGGGDDEETEMAQKLIIKEQPLPRTTRQSRKGVTKKPLNVISSLNTKTNGTTPIVSAQERPLVADKTKALCTEDFFALMLHKRVSHMN